MRLQMLQVARLAPNALGDSADRVAEFVASHQTDCGAWANRAGDPDLYYTVFGIESTIALRRELPTDRIATYLETFGDGDGLDLIHLCCLARCWAGIGMDRYAHAPRLAQRIGQFPRTSVYDTFMQLAAYEDLGVESREVDGVAALLDELATGDGGYANDADITIANTPATAAAVTIAHALGLPFEPKSADWLLGSCHAEGGFFAMPMAPMPDLLSTAVALHALSCMKRDIDPVRERCLDFVDTLWSSRGGFYGNWAEEEDALDVEYTWYGLLTLGHLSV